MYDVGSLLIWRYKHAYNSQILGDGPVPIESSPGSLSISSVLKDHNRNDDIRPARNIQLVALLCNTTYLLIMAAFPRLSLGTYGGWE